MHRGRLCRRRQVFQIDPAQAADRNQAELIQVDFQAFALARLDDTLFTLDITSQVKSGASQRQHEMWARKRCSTVTAARCTPHPPER